MPEKVGVAQINLAQPLMTKATVAARQIRNAGRRAPPLIRLSVQVHLEMSLQGTLQKFPDTRACGWS